MLSTQVTVCVSLQVMMNVTTEVTVRKALLHDAIDDSDSLISAEWFVLLSLPLFIHQVSSQCCSKYSIVYFSWMTLRVLKMFCTPVVKSFDTLQCFTYLLRAPAPPPPHTHLRHHTAPPPPSSNAQDVLMLLKSSRCRSARTACARALASRHRRRDVPGAQRRSAQDRGQPHPPLAPPRARSPSARCSPRLM